MIRLCRNADLRMTHIKYRSLTGYRTKSTALQGPQPSCCDSRGAHHSSLARCRIAVVVLHTIPSALSFQARRYLVLAFVLNPGLDHLGYERARVRGAYDDSSWRRVRESNSI